jgi:transcriptional regulator with XRE-family HTH domain
MPRPPLEESYRVRDPALLRQLLKSTRHSYRTLAEVVGCSKSMVHLIVTGGANASPRVASAIAEELKVDRGVLFVLGSSSRVDNTVVVAGRKAGVP